MFVRHPKSHKRCFDIFWTVYFRGFGSDRESLKGLPLHNAKESDVVRLCGPCIPMQEASTLDIGTQLAGDGIVWLVKMSREARRQQELKAAYRVSDVSLLLLVVGGGP